jgi:hypothetical protein
MSILIEQFVTHAYAISRVSSVHWRLEIQRLIDEYEQTIRDGHGDDVEAELQSFYANAEARMFQEIGANSPDGTPTTMAAFCKLIFDELSSGIRTLRH